MQNGRYEILETIGTGASSFVAKARDTLIGRTVALKTLHRGFTEVGTPEQFLREARIVGQLNDPSIVGLFDVGIEEKGTPYLVMEYVPGKTLEKLLADGPIPFQKACAWGADLASALARAHQAGIIHGDVKPANILVTEEGRVKLGDFGIARFAAQVSCTGPIVGTPAYLSPEQIAGQPQDARSDLFSLAIVIYQMVAGERPFDGTSLAAVCAQIMHSKPAPPSKHNPAIPAGFDRILLRCLSKDPADRYATGDELARDVYPFARRSPQSATPTRAFRTSLVLWRRTLWATAALATLAVSSVAATRHLRERLRIPPAPASVVAAPKAPADLFGSTRRQEIAAVAQTLSRMDRTIATSAESTTKHRHHSSVATTREPVGKRRNSAPRSEPPLQFPILVPSLTFADALTAQPKSAPLHIEILAHVSGETLAIYADRELLFTTPLHGANPTKPLRLERTLPLGPHQLRVALYRPDKSLQTEKEGLAEIHSDADNKLNIRVMRRSKFLLKRDTALEVSWPSAAPLPSPHPAAAAASTNPAPLSATFHKD